MGQFGTLYWKNFLFWRRDTCCCICQILTTFVFALLLLGIKSISKSSAVYKDDTRYLGQTMTGGDISLPAYNPFKMPPISPVVTSEASMFSLYQGMAELPGLRIIKNCSYMGDTSSLLRGGYVAIAIKSDPMYTSLNTFFNLINVTTKRIGSVSDLGRLIEDPNYGKTKMPNGISDTICFGLTFDEEAGAKWAYRLHFNSSGNPNNADIPDSVQPQEILFKEEDETDRIYAKYLSSGALLVQSVVDNLIFRTETGSPTAFIKTRFVKMPVKGYSNSGLYSNTNGGQIDVYVVFPLLVIYLGFIFHMLKEKEKKITENMRNMGMSLLPHYLSWLAFYMSVLFICSIIWALIVKASFFSHSNFILIWLLYMLPGMCLLSLSFIVCSFFVTAKPGVLFGIVSFFILYAISIGKTAVDIPTEEIYSWFALSPFTSLSFAASNMTLLESLNNFGFGFENFSTLINFFRYRTFVIICLVEFVVFFLIGIYLDQVWPTEIGIKKHPLFCFGVKPANKEFDTGKNIVVDAEYQKLNYETLPAELVHKKESDPKSTIQIKNLRKVYSNGKVAVHDLSFDIFDNQIFALLGHNGAGKTTTISMISGLLTQTKGTINICGFDTLSQYEEIKGILGVCPQQNPIYDSLTCREHLELYGNLKLKGKGKVSEQEIDQILHDIDLGDKKNFIAGRLSGGQKRKLCVGIAFIGGSKVILLDEPTSGMDTYARRHLWEMVKRYKKDRIIILCTHYMDEADFLGDRFGIMGEGRLITCGSSLFLKKRFGVGYDLTVVKENITTSTAVIEKLIKNKVPSAELTGDISMEVKFRLPNEQSQHFEALFQELEDGKAKYGVQSFGISLTTLEEVFLKVAVGIHEKTEKASKDEIKEEDMDFDLETIRVKGTMDIFKMHFMALCQKRFIYFKRDYKGVFCEIVLPIIIITFGLLFTLVKFVKDPVPRDYTPEAYFSKNVKIWANQPSFPPVGTGLAADYSDLLDRISGVPRFTLDKRVDVTTISDFQTAMIDERVSSRYDSYFIDKIDRTNLVYSYSLFYNTTVPTSTLIGINQMNNAILKQAKNDNSAYIKVKYEGLKLTKQIKSFENTADGFIAVFIFALAYAFIPAGVILFIVKERESNAKHQQIVSGVSIYAYWFSNLLIDVAKYMIPGIYCALSVLIFGIKAFTDEDHYSMVWALVLLYGPAIMTFTYLTSFLFKSAESAQIATFVFNFLAGFILMLLSFVLRAIKSTRDYAPYVPELILRVLPTYNFSWGMFEVANGQIWQILYKLDTIPKAWSRWGALIDVIYLICIPFVCMGIIFFLELRSHHVNQKSHHNQGLVDLIAGDEDVKSERAEVMASEDYAVKVVDFAKEYVMVSKQPGCCTGKLLTTKTAVKGVTFGVKKGECFGLLGTNGAGKTTTFKALSGEIVPSFGVTKIAGYDLTKDMNKVRYLIGYCPQFDALLDNLTAREHLELFASIKGIPYNMREKLIKEKLVQLNLKSFENVQAGTYSGGNKRKLSVAIALLGNPPIILLDEPSSGMDPEARRFMWSVVSKISTEKKHSSVVLTTHSMEEAEALSTKLAIMVEGSIECIGSVQKLKNKYGKGFEVEVKIAVPNNEEVSQMQTSLGLRPDQPLDLKDVYGLFDRLSLADMKGEIKKGGALESIYSQVESAGSVSQALFFNQALLYVRVKALEQFLKQHFGSCQLIESVNSFFRYKLPEGLKISRLFGELERNVILG